MTLSRNFTCAKQALNRGVRIRFDWGCNGMRGHRWPRRPSFVLKIILGNGAGYLWGRTLFVAYRSGSLRWLRDYRGGQLPVYPAAWKQGYYRIGDLEFGFTHNANIVPYLSN
jgi:hypothetical protein